MSKKNPYLTVQEMKTHPEWLEKQTSEKGGSRFEGGTDTSIVDKYCSKDEPILECGPIFGKFTKFLLDQGFKRLHVLDFSDKLSFVQKNEVTSFQEIDFNTERFPFEDNFFGSICSWGIVEHLENPFHFMREMYRVLKPGGTLLMSMPNPMHLRSRLNFLFHGVIPRWNHKNNHIALFTNGMMEKTYYRYFELVEKKYLRPNWHLYKNNSLPFLPANQFFGNYTIWAFRKRKDIL